MNLQPLGNRVLVRPLTAEEVTASGIVLPNAADREKKGEAEIIAIGDGEDVTKLGLSVGDVVLFSKYAADEFEYNDEDFASVDHDKILAVVKK